MKLKIPQINKALLFMKSHYFLQNAGLGPISPFIPIIAKDLGFSSISVGWIYTATPIVSFFMKPIIGGIADKFKIEKVVFILALILSGISLFSMQWVPPVSNTNSAEPKCNRILQEICSEKQLDVDFEVIFTATKDNVRYLNQSQREDLESFCDMETSMEPFLLNCSDVPLNGQMLTEFEIFLKYQFWLLLGLLVTMRVSTSTSYSIADAICLSILGSKPEDFGLQRLWAPMGWGLSAFSSSLLLDTLPMGQTNTYQLAFYISLTFFFLDLLLVFQLKVAPNQGSKYLLNDVTKVLRDPKICLFLMWCFLVGLYHSSISSFVFWFIEDLDFKQGVGRSEWIKTLEGLMTLFQTCLGEVPILFLSGWILKKTGHVNSMSIVLFAYVLRLFLYSTLTNPWLVLPVEILHGITSGFFYITMATYAKIISPPGSECTIQCLVSAMFEGAGTSVGALLTGYLVKLFGYTRTYLILATSALLFFILHLFLTNYHTCINIAAKIILKQGKGNISNH